MTPEQILKALDKYIRVCDDKSFIPERFSPVKTCPDSTEAMHHAYWMAIEAKKFAVDRPKKAMRWLCFIQGVLWTSSNFTIDEFKNDNRG